MDKPPYLTLVDPERIDPGEQEFTPLPFYPWTERPETLPVDADEAATAIHLAQNLPDAADLLKIPLRRLVRLVKHSPRLTRVLAETTDILVAQAAGEYARALQAPDARRREWGATKIMQSRAAAGHPLSPAPPNSTLSLTATQTDGSRRVALFLFAIRLS
jgi:hypothetical protein